MSSPVLARKDPDGNRFYEWIGTGSQLERFWSVTTLIDLGVPKYLVPWAVKLVAELAYGDVTELVGRSRRGARAIRIWEKRGRAYVAELQAQGQLRSIDATKLTPEEFALRWLKGEPDRVRDAAAARGSAVHEASEEFVLEAVREAGSLLLEGRSLPAYDDEIAPYMASFLRFLQDFRPRFAAAEATVFNRAQAYAGTLDALMWLRLEPGADEQLTVVDYKTGNKVYAEVAMQLAAYARGEFVGMPDGITEAPMPPVAQGAVLHLQPATKRNPQGYALRPVAIDDGVFRFFCFAREVARWRLEASKVVLGKPLAAPEREEGAA